MQLLSLARAFRLTGLSFSAGLFFLGLYPPAVLAAPVCQTGSLASYIGLDEGGGGCTIGEFSFFDFAAPTPTVTGSPTVATDSQITLTPILTGTGAGFSFTALAGTTNLFSLSSPSGTAAVTYYIEYSADPAPILSGGALSMDPPYGDVLATQKYCASDLFPGCPHGTESQQTVTPANPSSSVSFPNPSSLVDIETQIALSATPGDPANIDSVTALVNTEITPTPEPSALLLTSGPLVLLSMLRRKRA